MELQNQGCNDLVIDLYEGSEKKEQKNEKPGFSKFENTKIDFEKVMKSQSKQTEMTRPSSFMEAKSPNIKPKKEYDDHTNPSHPSIIKMPESIQYEEVNRRSPKFENSKPVSENKELSCNFDVVIEKENDNE